MNVYVHVPFCGSKCGYCAFYSVTGAEAVQQADYLRALEREWALRQTGCPPLKTLYVGGGTPSQLGADGIETLLACFPSRSEDAEVTVEVNPADVSPPLAAALRRGGVTRVSIGAQSLDPAALARLGRRHDPAAIRHAVACLRAAGVGTLGLDVIACIPGVTPDGFRATLGQIVALEPEHVSVYPLVIEPETPFGREQQAGRLAGVGDDEALDAVADAESVLTRAGYDRYEISNFSRPGFACRHNLAVWRGEDYVGIGPSAASRQGLARRTNAPDLTAWRLALAAGRDPPAGTDLLSPAEDEHERFVMRLRLAEGVTVDSTTIVGRRRQVVFDRLCRLGLVRRLPGGAHALTARGREVADAVMAEF